MVDRSPKKKKKKNRKRECSFTDANTFLEEGADRREHIPPKKGIECFNENVHTFVRSYVGARVPG